MTTVRKLSKSVPRPLSLVLGRTCRNATSSCFRVSRTLTTPTLSFSPAVRSAGGYASGYRSHRFRLFAAVRRSALLW